MNILDETYIHILTGNGFYIMLRGHLPRKCFSLTGRGIRIFPKSEYLKSTLKPTLYPNQSISDINFNKFLVNTTVKP